MIRLHHMLYLNIPLIITADISAKNDATQGQIEALKGK